MTAVTKPKARQLIRQAVEHLGDGATPQAVRKHLGKAAKGIHWKTIQVEIARLQQKGAASGNGTTSRAGKFTVLDLDDDTRQINGTVRTSATLIAAPQYDELLIVRKLSDELGGLDRLVMLAGALATLTGQTTAPAK